MMLANFFTVALTWCNMCEFILNTFFIESREFPGEPALSSLAPQIVNWQPLVAPVAAGLALWQLSAFSVPVPVSSA